VDLHLSISSDALSSIIGGTLGFLSDLFGSIFPVILDLDGNGVDITPLGSSTAAFDVDHQPGREHTAWVGPHDGLLAIDLGPGGRPGPDGIIDQTDEISFTGSAPGASSDMAALRQVFDTNQNGRLDIGDDRWDEFRVWQDTNSDGISQPSKLHTLHDMGIDSIGLDPASLALRLPDGSAISGVSIFTRTDGSIGMAGDVGLAFGGGAWPWPDKMQGAVYDSLLH
jgi:hypothetical protein